MSNGNETFLQTTLMSVSCPARICVSLSCLQLEGMKLGCSCITCLGVCYLLMPAPAKYLEWNLRLPLLGESRQGEVQMGGSTEMPQQGEETGKDGMVSVSLSAWLISLSVKSSAPLMWLQTNSRISF